MIELRPAHERGFADHGWLKSWHSFSFASYQDPEHVQFGPLRVINEDVIAPGTGFGMHAHRDMEIITYVLGGAISHRDDMGHESVIRPGSVQRMSAGTGVRHSEHNRDSRVATHMLQIWIHPNRIGSLPSYEEREIEASRKRGRLALIASGDGAEGSVTIQQDARLWAGCFEGDEQARLALTVGRRAYVHVARGALCINGQTLGAGDAARITNESQVDIAGGDAAEVLVFDLP